MVHRPSRPPALLWAIALPAGARFDWRVGDFTRAVASASQGEKVEASFLRPLPALH